MPVNNSDSQGRPIFSSTFFFLFYIIGRNYRAKAPYNCIYVKYKKKGATLGGRHHCYTLSAVNGFRVCLRQTFFHSGASAPNPARTFRIGFGAVIPYLHDRTSHPKKCRYCVCFFILRKRKKKGLIVSNYFGFNSYQNFMFQKFQFDLNSTTIRFCEVVVDF